MHRRIQPISATPARWGRRFYVQPVRIVGRATARCQSEDKPAAQMDLLTKAIAVSPGYAFAYYVKSGVLWLTKEYPEALATAETEVALDPNSAYGYAAMGRAEGLLGRCEQSIAHIKQAFALSPRDPLSGFWYAYLGLAEACRGRLDVAIEQFKRAISSGYLFFLRQFGGC